MPLRIPTPYMRRRGNTHRRVAGLTLELRLKLSKWHDPIRQPLGIATQRAPRHRDDPAELRCLQQSLQDTRADHAAGTGQPDSFPKVFNHAPEFNIPV